MSQSKREGSPQEDANRFVRLVNDGGFWRSVDLRVCAIRSGRQWMNLVTRGFLDHRPPRSVPRFSPVERRHFRAWQVVRPVADLSTIVRGIANGMMKLRPRYVRYVGRSGQPANDFRYSFNELAGSYRTAEYDLWSGHTLVGYGSTIFDVVLQAGHDPFELDGMIRGGPNAYDGLPDLVRRFCARTQGLQIQGNTTVVELIAPLAVRFDPERASSSADRVIVGLRAAADVFVANAELTWTVGKTPGAPVRHGSAKLAGREWALEGGAFASELDIPVENVDSTATAFIVIGNRCVDRVSVPLASTASSIRIKAQDALDPGLERFLKHLRGRGKDKSQQFEAAVGLLFFFLGFHVHPLSGHTRRGEAVDHIAHAPGSAVMLVIECTVGSLDTRGKLGKLIARSEYMRGQFPDCEVITILATASARGALSKAEVEKAERDDVLVLAQEDLQDLWIAAQAGETGVQAVHRFRWQISEARLRRTKGSIE
ncbi:MAG: hypothetical protein OXI76_00875 [Gemmatimonadota bacterium]|nr:hypothetical protein [Gemmatimonadota bacterium]